VAAAVAFFALDGVDAGLFAGGQVGVVRPAAVIAESADAQVGFEAVAVVFVDRVAGIPKVIATRGHGRGGYGEGRKRKSGKLEEAHVSSPSEINPVMVSMDESEFCMDLRHADNTTLEKIRPGI